MRRLVTAGFRVYLGARSSERGQPAAGEAGAQFDVTPEESVIRAAATVEPADGHLDVLVNNAGITGPLKDAIRTTQQRKQPLDQRGRYVRMIHAFLPLLERATDPHIINVSSGLGSFALFHDLDRIESYAGTPFYAASKAAINMLTARYARLLPNIRINVADPGMTATHLSGGQGHSVRDRTDAILAFALSEPGGPSGTFRDRDGKLPW